MARPRKAAPADPLSDLPKKTEILEREMAAQRAAMERLKELGKIRPQPLPQALRSIPRRQNGA